jgi:hypothetical protein
MRQSKQIFEMTYLLTGRDRQVSVFWSVCSWHVTPPSKSSKLTFRSLTKAFCCRDWSLTVPNWYAINECDKHFISLIRHYVRSLKHQLQFKNTLLYIMYESNFNFCTHAGTLLTETCNETTRIICSNYTLSRLNL